MRDGLEFEHMSPSNWAMDGLRCTIIRYICSNIFKLNFGPKSNRFNFCQVENQIKIFTEIDFKYFDIYEDEKYISVLEKVLSTSIIFYILHQLHDVVVACVVKSWWDDHDSSWEPSQNVDVLSGLSQNIMFSTSVGQRTALECNTF